LGQERCGSRTVLAVIDRARGAIDRRELGKAPLELGVEAGGVAVEPLRGELEQSQAVRGRPLGAQPRDFVGSLTTEDDETVTGVVSVHREPSRRFDVQHSQPAEHVVSASDLAQHAVTGNEDCRHLGRHP
jgi:hypothetical protein